MSRKILWSERADQQLRLMRASHHTWVEIAIKLGVGRSAAIERARDLGIVAAPVPPRRPIEAVARMAAHGDRPSMPPGHPLSWSAITAGTTLDGEPYPLPVFL